MSKFSIYRYLFRDITKSSSDQPDLFAEEDSGKLPDYWDKRVDIFTRLFTDLKEKLVFQEGDIVYPHRLIDCPQNKNVAIMRFANVKEIELEKNFKHEKTTYNPSCVVFIDNRKGIRHIAIQRSRDSFYSTDMVARILELSFNKMLAPYGLSIVITAQRYPKNFWAAYHLNEHRACGVRFSLNEHSFRQPDESFNLIDDVPQSTTDFLIELEEMYRETGGEPSVELNAPKGNILHLREDSARVKRYVMACADAGLPITFRTVDGLTFECFAEKGFEEEDKIVMQDFDDRYLPTIDTNDLFNTPTQHVIEFLNSIKVIRKPEEEDPDDKEIR